MDSTFSKNEQHCIILTYVVNSIGLAWAFIQILSMTREKKLANRNTKQVLYDPDTTRKITVNEQQKELIPEDVGAFETNKDSIVPDCVFEFYNLFTEELWKCTKKIYKVLACIVLVLALMIYFLVDFIGTKEVHDVQFKPWVSSSFQCGSIIAMFLGW